MSAFDPRFNKPSASGLSRILACRGSFKMEQRAAAEGVAVPSGKMAESGTRTHGALSGDVDEAELAIQEQTTAEMCERDALRIYEAWKVADIPLPPINEVRLGLTILGKVIQVTPECQAEIRFTGQFDRLYIEGKRGLLVDWKTMRGDHPTALENPQLAALVYMAAMHYRLEEVTVALVQPWKSKPTTALYSWTAIGLAGTWLHEILNAEEMAPEDDRAFGKHCAFCKARNICETFQDAKAQALEIINPMTLDSAAPKDRQRAAIFARIRELPQARLAAAYRNRDALKWALTAIEDTTKALARSDESFRANHYRIDMVDGDREITDAQAALDRLAALNVSAEDMIAIVKVPITKLTDVVRRKSGPKGKRFNLTMDGASEAMEQALGDAMARKKEERLIEVTPALEEPTA